MTPPVVDTPGSTAERLDRLKAIVRPMMQDRPYHNVEHVETCSDALRRYGNLAKDPDAIELALWLHDAVYDPTRADNEAESAKFGDAVLARLGYPPAVVATVHGLVLATRHDADPVTPDGRLIADIDLLVLAGPPDAFDQYERQVRQEYRHVADADFARGRAGVLARFLERPCLYYALAEHEQAARQNLRRSIAQWRTVAAADDDRPAGCG